MTIGMAQKINIHFIIASSAAADRGRFPALIRMSHGHVLPLRAFFSSARNERYASQGLVFALKTGFAISLSRSPVIEIMSIGTARSLARSEIASANPATAINPVFPLVMSDTKPL